MDLTRLRAVNLCRLSKITENTESTINFVKDVGLIPKSVKCPTCSAVLERPYYVTNRKATQIHYQCNKRRCRERGKNSTTIKSHNWFNQSNLTMQRSLFLIYSWVHQLFYKDTIHETSIGVSNDHVVVMCMYT